MAQKYTDNPEYTDAWKKANDLYFELYGAKDRPDLGLATQLDRLAYAQGEDSKAYKKAKQKFDKLQTQYNAAQAKVDALKADIDKANTAQKTKADAKKSAQKKSKDVSILEEQKKSALRRNDTATAQDIQDKIDALNKPKEQTTTGQNATVPLSDKQLLENEFAKAGLSSNGTVQYGFPNPNGQGSTTQAAYIYVEPGTKGAYNGAQLTPKQESSVQFGTTDEVVNKYYEQLRKQYGSKQGVVDALYNANILNTNKNVPAGSLLAALDKVTSNYTADQVLAFKDGVREFPSMSEYLANFKGGGGGTSYTRTTATVSSDSEAYNLALRVAKTVTGKKLDDKTMNQLVKLLQEQQGKNPAKEQITEDAQGRIVGRKTTTTGLDPEGFLINQISQGDDAKVKKILDYYSVYKRSMGVQ